MASTKVYTFTTWTIWFRNYYVSHAFVECNDYYSVGVCDVFEIYDNNIWPMLIIIIINIILSYISNTTHTLTIVHLMGT